MGVNTQGRRPAINPKSSITKKSQIHAHTGKFINTKGQTNVERIRKQQRTKEVIIEPGHAIISPTIQKLATP